jgi:hypothetical protein
MPTEPAAQEDARVKRRRDMELSIEELNVRIARLAIALGVSLKSNDQVTHLMSQSYVVAVPHERRGASERRLAPRDGAGPDRRLAHQREELRGLLVLRYELMKHYLNEVGLTATHEIMDEAEDHLLRRGFKPGADGVDMGRLFDKS